MSGEPRRVLIVCARRADSPELAALVDALRRQGGAVDVRGPDAGNEDLLDAIAEADVVVGWK